MLFESWITDLQRSHYLEPPVIPRRRGSMNPCLGKFKIYNSNSSDFMMIHFYNSLMKVPMVSMASPFTPHCHLKR